MLLIKSLSVYQGLLKKLFNNEEFQKKIISEDEFFIPEKLGKIELYETLLTEDCLEKFTKTIYYRDTQKVLEGIKNKLGDENNLKVEFSKLKELDERHILRKRLFLLFPKESEKIELDSIYNMLKNNLKCCNNNLDKLKNRINYLEIFGPTNKKIKDYQKKYKELIRSTIYVIKNEKLFDEKFNKFDKEQVNKTIKYQKSIIFMKLLDQFSNKIFDETLDIFKNIFFKLVKSKDIGDIIFLKKEKNIDIMKQMDIYKESIKIILKFIKEQKEEKIKEEIKIVYGIINEELNLNEEEYKLIENIRENDNEIKLLINKIKLFSYYEDIKYVLNCLSNLFNNLKPKNKYNQEGKLTNQIQIIYESLSDEKTTFEKMENAKNFLKNLGFDIFEINKNLLYTFISEIIDKNEEIKFCKEKSGIKKGENGVVVLKDFI